MYSKVRDVRFVVIAMLLCAAAAALTSSGTLLALSRPEAPGRAQRKLTLEERLSYQRAIEDVYWRHRIWPKENANPKPSLDAVISQTQLEKKVKDYLRNSQALEDYWQRPITSQQLQAELDRMARHTKQPEVLQELFEALGNDPFVIAECLARPALADRLITNWYAYDQRIHGELKQRVEAELQRHSTVEQMQQLSGKYDEIELVRTDSASEKDNRAAGPRVKLSSREWDETIQKLTAAFESVDMPAPSQNTAVTKYDALPVGKLSSLQEDDNRYYVTTVIEKTNDRLKRATVSWPKEPLQSWLARAENQFVDAAAAPGGPYTLPAILGSGCTGNTWTATAGPPEARERHTAVWTGSEMIVWGSSGDASGGRYNPSTDTWVATSTTNAPEARIGHTAVWTGKEMVVWGGIFSPSANTGGKYNPGTDSWAPTSTTNAPEGRAGHTAVWTGTQMIVWGGSNVPLIDLNTGGRYDPDSDSWTVTSTTNAPQARESHKAVWTGSEMIVWGGLDDLNFVSLNTGGRYNPNTNTWTATSVNNVPDARFNHTAVWTGSEMIVWGGTHAALTHLNTGGRYNPNTDTWTATNTTAPDARERHTAVWTGSEMIIWGGSTDTDVFNTGGRYNPDTDSWTAISTINVPDARSSHTAVWTGNEMIIWGGFSGFPNRLDLNTGGRYDPNTNSWTATNTYDVPDPRVSHTAVWTGSEMIVWGGSEGTGEINTGGQYNPSTDSWTATSTTNAPEARVYHTAVWTGGEMIVWGGTDFVNYFNTGGRYNPITDNWTATSTANAPEGRDFHTAVWTGSEMIVWGGGGGVALNTGGRYNPSTNSWTATSTTNAPSTRSAHTAVWTGSQMIVWGGSDPNGLFNTGGRYNPSTNSWTATSAANAPEPRWFHTAVWTGSEMIVWGGDGEPFLVEINTGGRYNPSTNSWTATSTGNAPDARAGHTAVWTGSNMIVWGGGAGFNTGGRYYPGIDLWVDTSITNAPSGRGGHTAMWTGSEMIVWGGSDLNTGGRYCVPSGIPTPTPAPTPCPGGYAVCNTNDTGIGSLRQAILNASSGDTINFAPSVTTVNLTRDELVIDKNLTIAGPGANRLTVQRSTNAPGFRIFNISSSTAIVSISGITISDGYTSDSGGGIRSAGVLTLTDCTISDNFSGTFAGFSEGGGVLNDHGTMTITGCTISNNFVEGIGGGVLNKGTMTITRCAISNNYADQSGYAFSEVSQGGGIFNGGGILNGGSLVIANSTISDNTSHATSLDVFGQRGFAYGGGVHNSGSMTIRNCTISGNSAVGPTILDTGYGGGISNGQGSVVQITSSTIAHNSATGGAGAFGGGIYGHATTDSSIIALNGAATGPDIGTGGLDSTGYNIIGNNANAVINSQPTDQIGTPAAPIDPLLGPLADNGGATETHALVWGSPAIDKGNSRGLFVDQRRFHRPIEIPGIPNAIGGDGSDIGAFEFGSFLPRADFNGDGFTDYLLFNVGNRATAIWYLHDNTYIIGASGPTLPVAWTATDVADFNDDSHPDYALFNPNTRQTGIWYLNNNVYVSGAYGPTLPSGWQLVAVGDFNGDSKPDYVLYNANTRQTGIWYLRNNVYVSGAFGPTIASGYVVSGVADFNSDGKPDYLLYNAGTRQTAIWYLNNNVYLHGAFGPTLPVGWSLVAP
jgi:N-acetylneuraminic acid mutarotase